MSDDSEPSFRDRVENIREERADDKQSDSSEEDPSQDDTNQSFDERVEEVGNDAKQSFREQVEEIKNARENGENKNFQGENSSNSQWGVVAGVFLVGGILGAASNPDPIFGFFVIGFIFGGVAWAFVTESGKTFRKEFQKNMDNMQQQQQQSSSSSQPKVVCSNCGWRNPKSNNYCHDCGEKLDQ